MNGECVDFSGPAGGLGAAATPERRPCFALRAKTVTKT